jgi:ubiquinol-cytochrome c reductase cytochrome c subunit
VPGSRRPSLPTGAALLALLAVLFLPVLSSACREQRLPEADSSKRHIDAGKTIFERKCASCHGMNGDGRTMTGSRFKYANLIDGLWRGDGSLASIELQIRRGRDPMPKFEGKLTDEQIRETAAYVLELSQRKGKK